MSHVNQADGEVLTLSLDAMHLASPNEIALNDLPDDLLRTITSKCSGKMGGMGGMNSLRLVNKRLMQVVESSVTWIVRGHLRNGNGPDTFPLSLQLITRRFTRIRHITCNSRNLESLEGCPDGLESLQVDGRALTSLGPLQGCVNLKILDVGWAPKISDLGPLASSARVKKLTIHSPEITDLSAISSMPLLEELNINYCRNVKSLHALSGLSNLRVLWCHEIDPQTSLLPLASCTGLEELRCKGGRMEGESIGLVELRVKLPGLKIN